jgi:hypothetical protein
VSKNRIRWHEHIFKNEQKQNPNGGLGMNDDGIPKKVGFEHGTKREMPKKKTNIKMETTG